MNVFAKKRCPAQFPQERAERCLRLRFHRFTLTHDGVELKAAAIRSLRMLFESVSGLDLIRT